MLQQLSLHFFPSRRRLGERGTEMCLSTRSAGWQTVWWQSPQPPPCTELGGRRYPLITHPLPKLVAPPPLPIRMPLKAALLLW